jgi:hypothetical protein
VAIGELKPGAIRGVFVQKQRANVYTMMLIVAFIFILIANIFLYAEMGNYQWKVRVPPADMPPPDTHTRWQPAPAPTLAWTVQAENLRQA